MVYRWCILKTVYNSVIACLDITKTNNIYRAVFFFFVFFLAASLLTDRPYAYCSPLRPIWRHFCVGIRYAVSSKQLIWYQINICEKSLHKPRVLTHIDVGHLICLPVSEWIMPARLLILLTSSLNICGRFCLKRKKNYYLILILAPSPIDPFLIDTF